MLVLGYMPIRNYRYKLDENLTWWANPAFEVNIRAKYLILEDLIKEKKQISESTLEQALLVLKKGEEYAKIEE